MKRFLFFTLCILIFSSCEKFSFQIENLNNDEIQVLGHAGMGIHSLLPMNSLESIERCVDTGSDGTELDVQLTKDGYLVAYHDENLTESTCGSGLIRSAIWEDLANVCYTDYNIISNYRLMLVSEIIEAYSELIFSFDCKLYTDEEDMEAYFEEYSSALSNLTEDLGSNCFIESQDAQFLALFKDKSPSSQLLYYPTNFEAGLEVALVNGFHGLSIATDKITEDEVELAHSNGLWVSLWNVHTRSRNKEAILKSPDCIQADKLSHLLNLLD